MAGGADLVAEGVGAGVAEVLAGGVGVGFQFFGDVGVVFDEGFLFGGVEGEVEEAGGDFGGGVFPFAVVGFFLEGGGEFEFPVA